MTTPELDLQPVQDQVPAEELEQPEERDVSTLPKHKSSVKVNPNAEEQIGNFEKKDTVHMSIVNSGIRTKGTFTVARGRLHKSKDYYEYQLLDRNGDLYSNGKWFRDRDLKLEKKRP